VLVNLASPNLTPSTLASSISEDGVCLLSGEKSNLTYYCVDGDTGNILPSNVACVSRETEATFGCRFGRVFPIWSFSVHCDAPLPILTHNESCLAILQTLGGVPNFPLNAMGLVDFFDSLIKSHVKGILKVTRGDYTLDRFQYQDYLTKQGIALLRGSGIVQLGR
jgi:hypothetical protein